MAITASSDGDRIGAQIWVLGSFALTGGQLTMHSAVCVASAAGSGADVLPLSMHRGAFAAATVGAAKLCPGAAGVVYAKALRRGAGSAGLAPWLAQLWQVRRLVRQSRTVVLVRERRTGTVLRIVVRLALGGHVSVMSLGMAAERILRLGLGVDAPPVAKDEAEAACFDLISRTGAELRLTDQHVARALGGPQGMLLPDNARADLLALAQLARGISARTVEAAARHGRMRLGSHASRALDIALSPDSETGLPRIALHLRALGKRRRHWQRFVPGPPPPAINRPGPEGAVLRALAKVSQDGDAALLANLDRPVGDSRLTRRDWLMMLALRLPVERYSSLAAPWDCPLMAEALAAARPETPPPLDTATAPKLRLVGIASNGTGLAQNFWMSAAALNRAGLTPQLEPVDSSEATLAPFPLRRGPARWQLRGDATIYHLNADRVPQQMLSRGALAGQGPQIGFLLWELDRIPAAHRLALQMLDEVWVPTVFLKRVYQRHFGGPVVVMRKGIELPPPVPWPAPEPGMTRFLVCFDARSSVARKNPLAAVRAFQAAFPERRDMELVVKTTPAPPAHWGDPEGQMARIEKAAATDPRIKVIRRMLPFPELLGLIASSSALVSPHRAEGFGYLPAWALALGVPVVATDWGGTRDFCTALTSDPVPAELVDVPRSHTIFPCPGARWAEVDQGALAEAMFRVSNDPQGARARAQAGKLVIETEYSMSAQADRYADRLLRLGVLDPAETPVATASGGL